MFIKATKDLKVQGSSLYAHQEVMFGGVILLLRVVTEINRRTTCFPDGPFEIPSGEKLWTRGTKKRNAVTLEVIDGLQVSEPALEFTRRHYPDVRWFAGQNKYMMNCVWGVVGNQLVAMIGAILN